MTAKLPDDVRELRAHWRSLNRTRRKKYLGAGPLSSLKASRGVIVVDAMCADPYRITKHEFEQTKEDYLTLPGITVWVDGEKQTYQPQLLNIK
jgi:hypothetical protein